MSKDLEIIERVTSELTPEEIRELAAAIAWQIAKDSGEAKVTPKIRKRALKLARQYRKDE